MKQIDKNQKAVTSEPEKAADQKTDNSNNKKAEPKKKASSGGSKSAIVLALFLFILSLGAVAGAAWYGWLEYQKHLQQTDEMMAELVADLQSQIQQRLTQTDLDDSLNSIRQMNARTDSQLAQLGQKQESLSESTEKLYELYGRDENGWRLAEVEYLMSIAQHKLVLEQDFEGAAKTLDAASIRIAELADPGLLPVRVRINDEIAALKTRKRPDLVGMTLLISRLGIQVRVLKPEYVSQTEQVDEAPATRLDFETLQKLPWDQRIQAVASSLVNIRHSEPESAQPEPVKIIDVKEKLEDNLKLLRWTVLEREAARYETLLEGTIALFNEHYDLKEAANVDFHESLLYLQKSSLKAELPDISGSLRLLREIQQRQQNTPLQEEAENG